MVLAKQVVMLRKRRGWTQEQLAEYSGLSVRTIRNLELGRVQNPRQSSVELLAHVLNVPGGVMRQTSPVHVVSQWRGPQPPRTPLIGPPVVLEELEEAVTSHRLTTLTGPGGVGKTRYAFAVASNVSESFRHGVAFVELGDLILERSRSSDGTAAILQRIAECVGRQMPGVGTAFDSDAAVPDFEGEDGDCRWLLVLDNAEHVPAGVAAACRLLLGRFQGLHILITARRRLTERIGVNQEIRPLEVGGNGGGSQHATAVELVLRHLGEDFATAAGLGHGVSPLVELCRRLGGIPRNLEFAAEQMRAVPIETLLAEGPTAEMLWTNDHGLLPHQRSVAESIRWDLDLLTEVHRDLLKRLMRDDREEFTVKEVMAESERLGVQGPAAPLAILSELRELSLVLADPDSPYRYRSAPFVHETLVGVPVTSM